MGVNITVFTLDEVHRFGLETRKTRGTLGVLHSTENRYKRRIGELARSHNTGVRMKLLTPVL